MLDFLAYLEFERGLSRNTLEAYRSDLLQFGAHLEKTGGDALSLGHPDLAAFVAELAAGDADRPPVANATLQRKVACLRSFYRHLRRQEMLADDPTAHLRAPRQTRKLPQVLSRDEVALLLEQPRGTEPSALRDRALLEVMYACGLRASEATGLEVSRRGSCAPAGRAPRSASSRSAPRRATRSASTCSAAARAWPATGWSRACSSTTAARG